MKWIMEDPLKAIQTFLLLAVTVAVWTFLVRGPHQDRATVGIQCAELAQRYSYDYAERIDPRCAPIFGIRR